MSPDLQTAEDPCGCNGANNACKNGVEKEYQEALELAEAAQEIVSQKAHAKMLADAKNAKRFGLGICKQALGLCIGGCDE